MENNQTNERGIFVVFEGLDRSGKSTQSQMLFDHFQNNLKVPARKINFPDRTSQTGKLLNDYLQNSENKLNDEAVHLLFAMNRWEQKEELIESLSKQKTSLICDRYAYSGVAYSGAKGLDF